MADYAVFLRGVNVGGITIKMADLRVAAASLPVTRVKTLLASGNLTCTSALPPEQLKTAFETVLRTTFRYEAWVVILERGRLRDLVDACPFPTDDPATHTYITLFSDPAVLTELVDAAAGTGDEPTVLGPEAAAWQAPRGGTLDSPLNRLTAKPRFKTSTTTRNLRTLHKVIAALEG